jgi:hypothetical protein
MILSPSTIHALNEARSKRQAGYGKIVLKPNPGLRRKRAEQFEGARLRRWLRNSREIQEMLA